MPDFVPVFSCTTTNQHTPLALGMLQTYARAQGGSAVRRRLRFMPLFDSQIDVEAILKSCRAFGPGVWLFSNYLWSLEANLAISRQVKRIDARNITLHGGPSTPKYAAACEDFLRRERHCDLAVRGEGEATVAEVLSLIAEAWPDDIKASGQLNDLAGLDFLSDDRPDAELIRTPDRPRITDLNDIPSPYLEGVFNPLRRKHLTAGIVETNRGCPYGCTFCDWGSATLQKVRRFDLDRAEAEIDWCGAAKLPVLVLADANFGIYERDVQIAEFVANARRRYGFPQQIVVNYAKNKVKHIREIVKILVAAPVACQGIISIQTADVDTLKVIRRANIKTSHYDKLVEEFQAEGLPISTDLMIGLPGATIESFKRDLQFFFDKNVLVKAYRVKLLPNSPMADPEYMTKHQIRVDKDSQFLISTFSYDADDLLTMRRIHRLFNLFEKLGLLRYVLRYLQWDHQIPALSMISDLQIETGSGANRYPVIASLSSREIMIADSWSWPAFYDEVRDFICSRYDLDSDDGLDIALAVNQAVMPSRGATMPMSLPLKHDFVGYFRDRIDANDRPPEDKLSSYAESALGVADPEGICRQLSTTLARYDAHQAYWELSSPLRQRSPLREAGVIMNPSQA